MRLESATEGNFQHSRELSVSSTIPSMKLISEENNELKYKLSEIRGMYENAEKGRLFLLSKL